MRVLLTGAFGNVGTNALRHLVEQGHQVRCFDLKTMANQQVANKFKGRKFKGKVEVVWGDLRSAKDVAAAAQDQDVVVHLAFIIPSASEERPEWAREINVGGTRNLVEAMKALSPLPRMLFASSIGVFGPSQDQPPPRKASDAVVPTDNYTNHKAECERMVKDSGLEWVILRFGAVPPISLKGFDPQMYEIPLDARIELIHPADVGLAVASAVGCPDAWGKILLIGGGKDNQIYYREFIQKVVGAMGIGNLPDEAFTSTPYYLDWLDTDESQRLLNYQRHTYEDSYKEFAALAFYLKYLVRPVRPFVRSWLLNKSPYFRALSGRRASSV